MKKVKNPRGKIRGKSMKKIFACLLSLSMIPANGVAVFAAPKQAEVVSEQKNTEVKVQSDDAEIKLAQDSLISKIGHFNTYYLDGIDGSEVDSIWADYSTGGILELSSTWDYPNNVRKIGYMIVPKKVGTTDVTVHIRKNDGTQVTLPKTKLTVEANDNDDIVPITTRQLFEEIKSALNLSDSKTKYITKTQMLKVKKLNLNYVYVDNIDGIEYAKNCEEINLSGKGAYNKYNFSDVSKLAQLTKLKKIDLSYTAVRNISALRELKNLTYVNLNNTQVSTEDRLSLLKTDEVSIEAGSEVTDLLNPKGLIQTADKLTSSDSSVVSVESQKKSDGTNEWVFKAAEGKEGQSVTLTVENGTVKKNIKVNVVAKNKSAPDFAEKSIDTNIGCFAKIPLKNTDDKNIEITSNDEKVVKIARQYTYIDGKEKYVYRFEPKGTGKAKLIANFETEDGTKYRKYLDVNVGEVKDGIIPLKSYNNFNSLSPDEEADEITEKQFASKETLYLYDGDLEDSDMKWIVKAKKCKVLNLSSNSKILNIEQLENLKNLKELYLDGTSVSSIETLEKIKDNLEYLSIQNTKISEDDRFKLMPDEVTISEGTKSAKALYPNGLIEYQDTLSVEDNTIADVVEDKNYYHNAWMIVAKKGQDGKSTKLTIKNKDGKSKVITINVIKQKEDAPGFAETKMETSIGRFKEIKLKNLTNLDYNSMQNVQVESDNKNVEIKSVWESNDSGEEPTPMFVLAPKKAGKATITLTYKNNGTIYEDNMDVTVDEAEDDVVPITKYDFYERLNHNIEENLRTDCIKKSALASLEKIDLAYSGLTDLTGIEYATACKEINLKGNRKLKNINRLEKLNNLESIDLSNTAVSSVDSIKKFKNQLVYLNLKNTNVSVKDRLDFIREDQKITIEEGASKQIKLMLDGILEDSDQYSIDNESKFSIDKPDYGYSQINAKNAKEGETANLIIKNDSANGLEKHIPIEVISKKNKIPKFTKKSMTIEIGNLQEMQFKNVTKNISVTVRSDNKKILDYAYAYRDNKIHFVPKSEGTTTIHATFEKENGTVYTSDINVTVKKADESENIVPIKSMNTYDSLKDSERKSIDEDHNYMITQNEMDKVKEINLSDELENDDFAGLDYARNCEEFYFSAWDIDYNKELLLNLLKSMKNLKTLSLNCTNFTQEQYDQIFEGNDWNQLESLSLYSENIQNIECIKNLKQLQYLDLSHTNVSDISALENMTKLKSLQLDWLREIKDFSVIGKLTDLEELHLENTNFKDVKLLSGLTKLNCIDLEGTNISIEDRISLLRTKKIEIEDGENIDYAIYPKGILDYRDEIKLEKNIEGISFGTVGDEHGVNLNVRAKEGVVGATNIIIGDGEDTYAIIPLSVVSEKSGTPKFKEKEKTVSLGYVGDLASELENTENIESVIFDMKDEEYGSKILDIGNDEISGKTYLTTKATGKDTIIAQITTNDGKCYKKEMTVNVTENPSNIIPISNYNIFTSLLDSEGNSVDKKEKDGLISTTEILDVAQINANYSSVEDTDLDYLKKAVNAKKVDISDNKAITDLSFLVGFNKLEEINLDGDEKITDYTALIAKKDQLEKVVLPAEVTDSVRKDMLSTDKISVNVGDKLKKATKPDGLIFTSDKVIVKDPDIADAKIVEDEGEEAVDKDDVLNAHIEVIGKKEGTTTLTVQLGKETKEISVAVKRQSEDKTITFNQDSLSVKQATFKKWNFENVDSDEIKNIHFAYDGKETSDILEIVKNSDGTYTPIAKKDQGTVAVGAEIELKNGTIKKVGEVKFTVDVAPKGAVVINDYNLYKGMKSDGKSADSNGDGIISKEEIVNVDDIEVTNCDIEDLTGIEQAINCKKINLSNNALLEDISLLGKLVNVTSLNLVSTSVKEINALEYLTKLDYLDLQDSNVTEKDKLGLLRLSDMSMTEGESKTQEIKPTGLLGKETEVKLDSDIAEVKITDGKLEVTGKAAGEANLTIGNKNQKVTRTIKVTVKKKQEEPKPAPNPTTPGDNKPQNSSQNPTTAAPQKVAKITVTAPSNKLSAGKKVKLTANISNNASNKTIKWTTSNKKYATVDKNGVVKFNKKAAGKTVTITAYATDGSGKKATFKIKIMKGTVKKIKITGKKTVKAGKTLSLKAKVTASKGANKKLKWTSSNTKYATVSGSGKVKALKAGKKKSVKITAMATDGSGKKATVTIKIK